MDFSLKNVRSKLHKLNDSVQKQIMSWLKPAKSSVIFGTLNDVTHSKSQLIAENALLRQQLIVLNRQINKPKFTPLDRLWWLPQGSEL